MIRPFLKNLNYHPNCLLRMTLLLLLPTTYVVYFRGICSWMIFEKRYNIVFYQKNWSFLIYIYLAMYAYFFQKRMLVIFSSSRSRGTVYGNMFDLFVTSFVLFMNCIYYYLIFLEFWIFIFWKITNLHKWLKIMYLLWCHFYCMHKYLMLMY